MGYTHLSALKVAGTIQGDGKFKATAGSPFAVSGSAQLSGNVLATGAGKYLKINELKFSSASSIGSRTITTGGSGVVTTTKVHTASAVVLTPVMGTAGFYKNASALVKSITPGTSFKICLFGGLNGVTAGTGKVNWAIINP